MIPLRHNSSRDGRKSRDIFSLLVGIVLTGIIGYLAFSDWKIYQKSVELRKKTEILQEEMKKLEIRNAELERMLAETKTDEYRERVARERFNLKKPGEKVIVVVPSESSTSQKTEQKQQNFLQRILLKFPFLRD